MTKKQVKLSPNDVSSIAYEVFIEQGLYFFIDDDGYCYLADNEAGARPHSFESIEDVSGYLEELSPDYEPQPESNTIKLDYENGFARKQFVEHLIIKNNMNESGHAITFSLFMLNKIINYGHKHFDDDKERFAFFLIETIPELDEAEAFAFFADDELKENGRFFKKHYWTARDLTV